MKQKRLLLSGFTVASALTIVMASSGLESKTRESLDRPASHEKTRSGRQIPRLSGKFTPEFRINASSETYRDFQKIRRAKSGNTSVPFKETSDNDVPLIGGALHHSTAWTDWAHYGLYSFPASEEGPDNVNLIGEYYFFNTGNGAVYDDAIHAIDYNEYDNILYVNYNKVDLPTGAYVDYASLNDLSLYPYDCDYDPVTTGVIGCFSTPDNSAVELAFVDYDTKYRKPICRLPDILYTVAVNSKGEIYGIDGNGTLRQYSRTDGKEKIVMETGLVPRYMQSATFDRSTDKMYWAFTDGNESALYEIDTEAPSICKVFDFANQEEFTTLYVVEQPNLDTPETPDGLILDFGPENKGKISFTLPTSTRSGDALDGNLSYRVLSNGIGISEGKGNPGETVEINVTPDYGENMFMVTCSNNAGESRPLKRMRWIGRGQTLPPSGVDMTVENNKLSVSWQVPEGSIMDAYMNPDELTYTVTRYPDSIAVAENIKDLSFSETLDTENPVVVWYGVTALNDIYRSEEAFSRKNPVGDAFTCPYHEDFENPDNFELFKVLDNNNDGRVWMIGLHQGFNPTGFAFCNTNKYGLSGIEFSDDWLLTPNITVDEENIYEFNFIAWTMFGQDELLEVALGSGDDPTDESSYHTIMEKSVINRLYDSPNSFRHLFIPEKSGDIRVAFHGVSGLGGSALNIDELNLFAIGTASGPGYVENFLIETGEEGELSASVSFDTPVRNAADNADISGITLVELFRDGKLINEWKDVEPGAHLEYLDNSPQEGMNVYRVVCHSAEGKGIYTEKTAFTGLDIPALPKDFKAIDNGDAITLQWENPGPVGANGGKLNSDWYSYEVYNVEGNQAYTMESDLMETSYDIDEADQGHQRLAYYGVSAYYGNNYGGIAVSNPVILGTPHNLPFVETFNMAKFDNEGWWQIGDIEHIFYTYGEESSDEGSTAMMWSPAMGYTETWLNSGKITLENATNPNLIFDWKANPGVDITLDVYAVANGTDENLVYSLDLQTVNDAGQWQTATVDLGNYAGNKSMMLKFHAHGKGYGEKIWLDRIQVRNVLDHDLIANLTTSRYLTSGKSNTVTVNVENNGNNVASGYTVNLYVDDELCESREGVSLQSFESSDYIFEVTPPVTGSRNMEFISEILYGADQDPANNMTPPEVVEVLNSDLPRPRSIDIEQDGESVSLAWTSPDLSPKEVAEDFEYYDNGDLSFGGWKTFDGDKGLACGINGINMPHAEEPFAFMVFNPEESGMELDNRPIFVPYSGSQYLIAMVGYYSSAPANDDWLISPELSGAEQTLSFMLRKTTPQYAESIEVYYSDSDSDTGSFKLLGQLSSISDEWTEYSFRLPEGARYFAIRYNASGQFMIMLDDICYTPAIPELRGYRIYRNNEMIAEVGSDTLSYPLESSHDISDTYCVSAVFTEGESMPTNKVSQSGVDLITTTASVTGGKGEILFHNVNCGNVEVFSTDGLTLYSSSALESDFSLKISKGHYIVRVNGNTVKIIVR